MPSQIPTLRVLIDGACPLCRAEAALLRRLDRNRGRLVLEDIAGPSFEPAGVGRSLDELMGTIHGVLPDGTIVTGMEVFRRAYGAVGLGWLLAPTAWPGLRPLFDRAYRWFARNRLPAGRPPEALFPLSCLDRCVRRPWAAGRRRLRHAAGRRPESQRLVGFAPATRPLRRLAVRAPRPDGSRQMPAYPLRAASQSRPPVQPQLSAGRSRSRESPPSR
jgi:predicted DCC family thiol-disulfide oxidoreductase YuxK